MIRLLGDYIRNECRPNWRTLVFDSQILFSLAVVVFAMWRPGLPLALTVEKLTDIAIGYGATSLGFAITIYTLAMTLPQPETVALLVKHTEQGEKVDAYRKLLFIFSWTALSQAALVVLAFSTRVVSQPSDLIRWQPDRLSYDIMICLTLFALAYACLQFLSAILAVTQLGRIIARRTREKVLGEEQKRLLNPVKKHENR